jgi:hypothetical protein
MAKKKMTRDVPLPSSDGMFGGPGDPKKKTSYPRQYTAKDSVNYMNQIGDISQYERHIKKAGNYKSKNPNANMIQLGPMYTELHGMEDKRNDNPFHDTYRMRQSAKARKKK